MTDKELEKIYNEAYRAVYWTAFSLLKNEDDAQDIVQDTFIALFNSYDSIKDKSKIVAWLKKVAANRSLNRLTRTKTDTVEDEFFDDVETVPEDFLPDSLVESAEMRKIIMDIINNSLSEDIRRTLILFYFDEMSTKEIAEALGIPEGTVSRRIHSAKKKIKKEVEKYEKDNDTKLFMVVPFLTSLFTKEAEQVPFRPMPASLLNLSASTGAAEAAGNTIASQAIKKGTEITMKKIIIAAISVALAGAATTGIIYYVTHKDENTSTKKKSKKKAENEIAEIEQEENDPNEEGISKDQTANGSGSKSASGSGSGSESDGGAEDDFATADRHYVNYIDLKVSVKGTVITMGKSTIQDVLDAGTYVNPHLLNRTAAYGLKLDDPLEAGDLVYMTVFDLEDGEDWPSGQNANYPMVFLAKAETAGPVSEAVICGVHYQTQMSDAWENEVIFEFPFTLTPEALVADSGEATSVETGTDESYYRYENGDCSMVFIFYKGELKSIYGEYDAGSRIDLTYGLVGVEE